MKFVCLLVFIISSSVFASSSGHEFTFVGTCAKESTSAQVFIGKDTEDMMIVLTYQSADNTSKMIAMSMPTTVTSQEGDVIMGHYNSKIFTLNAEEKTLTIPGRSSSQLDKVLPCEFANL